MALITPPTAQEIYDEAGHNGDQGLSFEHFGRTTDQQVLDLINTEILPVILARVNNEADEVAFPFDYPLSMDTWKSARPTFTDAQIGEEIANQDSTFRFAARKLCAAELLLTRVVTTNEFWIERGKILQEAGEKLLIAAKASVTRVVQRTLDAQNQGQAGFGVVAIDVEPQNTFDEFGGFDATYWGALSGLGN